MRYIFYADVYFLQNFMMKVAVLYLSLYCNKKNVEITRISSLLKICLVSGVGTVIEILGLLMSSSYHVFVVGSHLLEVSLMVHFVLEKEKQGMMRVIAAGYFFTVLINGVLEALWNQFGECGGYLFVLVFSCGAVIVGVRIWRNYTKRQKGIFHVELSHQRKRIQTNGLYDSGNHLKDPFTGKGVHIISKALVRKVGIYENQTIKSPVYIPYQSLGNEQDLLEVYYIEKLIIEGERGRITIQNCPVGVTKDNLFEGKNYEIILNEEVF